MPYIETGEEVDIEYIYDGCSDYEKKKLVKLLKKDGFIPKIFFQERLLDGFNKELLEKLKFILLNSNLTEQQDFKNKIEEIYLKGL